MRRPPSKGADRVAPPISRRWSPSNGKRRARRSHRATIALFLTPAIAALAALPSSSVAFGNGSADVGRSAAVPMAGFAPLPPDRHGWTNVTSVTREPSPALEAFTPSVYDEAGGTSLAFGGLGANGNVSGTTWIFDDGNWEDVSPVINGSSPPPLYDENLAYDASDGYLLLFGGRTTNGSLYGGTWSWSFVGYRWTNRTGPVAPHPEAGGGMAYDPLSGEVVLLEPSSNLTWTYHSGSWRSAVLTPSPDPRTGAILVTDRADGYVFLFGGQSPGGKVENDTWSYSRGAWRALDAPDGPPPLLNASGADNSILGGVFVVGSAPRGATGTWRYGAGVWIAYAPATLNPPARRDATLAFDSSGAMVLCGGLGAVSSALLNDCWTWGVEFIPPNSAANPSTLSRQIVVLAVLVIGVPVALALLLSRRPKRPDVTRAPSPFPQTA